MFRKCTIRFLSGFLVSRMGFLNILKKAEINAFSSNRKMGLPLLSCHMPRYANITGSIIRCFRTIHAILLMSNFTQITQTIVRSITIYVIYFTKRPNPIHHGHGNSMCWNYKSIDANFNVPIGKSACAMSNFCPLRCIFPCEASRIGVIGKFLVQCGYRNLSHSYDIPSFLNGGKYVSFAR